MTFRERFVRTRCDVELSGYKILRFEISLHDLEELIRELHGMTRFAAPVRRDIDQVDGEYDGLPYREVGDAQSRFIADPHETAFPF